MSSKREERKEDRKGEDTASETSRTTTTTTVSGQTGTIGGTSSIQQRQQRQQQEVSRAIDETKDRIRRTVEDARKEIPRYTQTVTDYQNQTLDAAREITDSYLDSQREMINAMQFGLTQSMQQQEQQRYQQQQMPGMWGWPASGGAGWWGVPTMMPISPEAMTNAYVRMASAVADVTIATTRMFNNTMLATIESTRTSMNYARDNAREASRITSNMARKFEQNARETTSRGEA